MGSNPSKLQRPESGDNTAAGSDEYRISVKHKQYEFVCTTCARNYKHVSASSYCKSCQDHLCFRCLQWHGKFRDNHFDDLIDKDEMRKMGVQGSPVMPTEKCLDHDDKLWNMFCQKDGIAGCQQCMDEKHRTCDTVIPRSGLQIEAANRQLEKSNHPKNSTLPPNDGQVGGKLWQHVNDDGQIGGYLRQKVSDNGQVDGRKRQSAYSSEDLKVDGELETPGQRQYNDQVDGSKKINKQSIQATTSSTDDGQVPSSSKTDVEKQPRHENDGQVSGTRNQYTGLYSVGSGRDVNVRLDNDSDTCRIYDMSVLSDGRILMSDFTNNNLKLLHPNLNIIDHCDVQYKPACVCMINDNEAAVTMVACYIQFVSIEDKIELGRRIQLDHNCCGHVYSGGELYVSDGYTDIHVYTVEVEKLRTIEAGMCEEHGYGGGWLTVSLDGSRIYMTNYQYGIVCVDILSGQVIWKVEDTDDNKYTGVCVDRYNNVLVCRCWKHDVVQFSPSGQLTGVVINKSEGLRNPLSIGIDEVRNRLIVGMYDAVVKVFDMKSLY